MENSDAEQHRRKSELAGAVILKVMDAMPSGQVAGIILELLDAGLKAEADRALFGLPPRGKPGGSTPPISGMVRRH